MTQTITSNLSRIGTVNERGNHAQRGKQHPCIGQPPESKGRFSKDLEETNGNQKILSLNVGLFLQNR